MDLKKGILLLLILLFVNNLFSQIWCYPGAEWYYNRPFFSGSGYTKHTYVGNVTFQSINCQKISYYSEGYNNFSQSIQTYSTTFYTYVSNNVVYHYFNDASTFDTLVNFNASIGDSWYTPYNSTCGYKKFKVLDTGHHVIQGQNLKWLKINLNGSQTDTIYERIGYLGFYMFDILTSCYNDVPLGGLFRCYSDNQIQNFKKTTNSCTYYYNPTNLSEKEKDENDFILYPNPASSQFTIELINQSNFTKAKELKIHDVLGKEVKTFLVENNPQKINLNELSKGVYFVQLELITGIKVIKKLIVE